MEGDRSAKVLNTTGRDLTAARAVRKRFVACLSRAATRLGFVVVGFRYRGGRGYIYKNRGGAGRNGVGFCLRGCTAGALHPVRFLAVVAVYVVRYGGKTSACLCLAVLSPRPGSWQLVARLAPMGNHAHPH